MNDEYIDIADENGVLIGKTALKSDAHKNGWHHHTTHLWIFNKQGQVLLAQRSLKKLICPGLWDVSAAGHIDAGEEFKLAALREAKEELGIELEENDLIKIGVFKHESDHMEGKIKDYEFHNCYICHWNGQIDDLKLQASEVDQVKWVSFSQFEDLLRNSKNNNHFIESNSAYYLQVINSIKEELAKRNH